jgi:uncharacterized protein
MLDAQAVRADRNVDPQGPVDSNERIIELDALRGVALGGIVVANARQLLLPWDIADYPLPNGSPRWLAWLDWSAFHALIDLKFLTLFSLLFGIGFAVQGQRLKARGAAFTAVYMRRALILAVFGLAHGLLLYPAEVLLPYAVAGVALLALDRLAPRTLIHSGLVLLGVSTLWGYQLGATGTVSAEITLGAAVLLALSHALLKDRPWPAALATWTLIVISAGVLLTLPAGPAPPSASEHEDYLAAQAQLSSMLQPDDGEVPEEFQARAQGSFTTLLHLHARQYGLILLAFVLVLLWRTLAIFLIGAGLWRLGLLSRDRSMLGRRLSWIGLGVGLPLTLAATALHARDMVGASNWHWPQLLHALSALPLAAGIAGVVLLLHGRSRSAAIWSRIDAMGRMALTNYIAQSFFLAFVAERWGLGRYGQFDGPQITLIALMLYVALAEASYRWLARFRMGPLEWLWRCGTYGRWLEFREPRGLAVP